MTKTGVRAEIKQIENIIRLLGEIGKSWAISSWEKKRQELLKELEKKER
jgi:hypothetical protein